MTLGTDLSKGWCIRCTRRVALIDVVIQRQLPCFPLASVGLEKVVIYCWTIQAVNNTKPPLASALLHWLAIGKMEGNEVKIPRTSLRDGVSCHAMPVYSLESWTKGSASMSWCEKGYSLAYILSCTLAFRLPVVLSKEYLYGKFQELTWK